MAKKNGLKSSIGNALTLLYDLMALNACWVLCSLPVFTIGASTTALYSVMLKVANGEPVATFRDFFVAFRRDFKQGVFAGLISIAAGAVVYADFAYGRSLEGTFRTVFLLASGIGSVLWFIYTSYTFALIGRFENTLKGHIRNAFALAALNPLKSVIIWLIMAVPVILFVVLPFEAIAYIGWIYLIFGVSLPLYFCARFLRRIFDALVPREPDEEDNDDAPEAESADTDPQEKEED